MWNDIKELGKTVYDWVNGWLWAAIFAVSILVYFGNLVVTCNKVGCQLMLK